LQHQISPNGLRKFPRSGTWTKNITAQLKAAGAIVGIELLDHIIFNRTGYFSFLEDGRL
jgi:DNA repair protein RadC